MSKGGRQLKSMKTIVKNILYGALSIRDVILYIKKNLIVLLFLVAQSYGSSENQYPSALNLESFLDNLYPEKSRGCWDIWFSYENDFSSFMLKSSNHIYEYLTSNADYKLGCEFYTKVPKMGNQKQCSLKCLLIEPVIKKKYEFLVLLIERRDAEDIVVGQWLFRNRREDKENLSDLLPVDNNWID